MDARREVPDGPVRLFANRFEKIAFWGCVAGLALALTSMGIGLTTADRNEFEARVAEQTRQIADLRAEVAAVRAQLDSLQGR